MGVATHMGLSATGDFVKKDTFPGETSDTLLKSRVCKIELEPYVFCHMLICMFHYILRLQQELPRAIIWLRKEDFKLTYQQIHLKNANPV